MDTVDAIVVGGGVVGLACALALARTGHEVLVLEAAATFGTETSSRNSGVIHAGLYYPEGSLKARLCVRGRDLLYEFCVARSVRYRQLGKLIFAAHSGELPSLERITQQALAAGVDDLRWLSRAEVAVLEPDLPAIAALHSPRTGIVDVHGLMLAMIGELEARGGQLACNAKVTAVRRDGIGWAVHISGESGAVVRGRMLVNAAGLAAQRVAATIEGLDEAAIPPLHYSRGCYFAYHGRVPFTRLIYPVPVPGGLGTHLTIDLGGQAMFGPNVQPIDSVDYTVDPNLHDEFVTAAKRVWPALDPSRLRPAYAGIRPKIAGPDGQAADFVISGPDQHGLPGLVLLFGIESPGLTAALAIGQEVAARLELSS
jgi:L-2-hydroxyglutarate oxidase LhgO